MEFIIVIVLIGGSILLSIGITELIELGRKTVEKKRKKAHPQLWSWMDECYEAGAEECRWYNAQVAPLKNKVDAILREWDYYTTDTKNKKMEELENLRKAIESAMEVYNEMCANTQALRDTIHNYVERHDLKWARSWGW